MPESVSIKRIPKEGFLDLVNNGVLEMGMLLQGDGCWRIICPGFGHYLLPRRTLISGADHPAILDCPPWLC